MVTRNTPKAVNAFFSLLGGSWRDRFSQVLTREFKYVKPDRRLLLHVAQNWGIHPSEMLMVGDSKEDVEVGALVGASTCLITGGGNEPFASCECARVVASARLLLCESRTAPRATSMNALSLCWLIETFAPICLSSSPQLSGRHLPDVHSVIDG